MFVTDTKTYSLEIGIIILKYSYVQNLEEKLNYEDLFHDAG